MLDAELIQVQANGLEFSVYVKGQGPLALCLHGFPDTPWTFHQQFPALVEAGFRVAAPYLRGYSPSQIPDDGCPQAAALGRDALGLIEALGADSAVVIGHDFGGAAALLAALLAPERVSKLVTIATPYSPKLMEVMTFQDYVQQKRFWYQYFFLLPAAEAAIPGNGFEFIRRLCRDWSPGWDMPEEAMAHTIETLAKPGVLKAALDYYHAMYEPEHQNPELMTDQGLFLTTPIQVPSQHIHGTFDGCMGAELCEGMEVMFAGFFDKVIVEEAGHFVHQEKPSEVNGSILGFLSS